MFLCCTKITTLAKFAKFATSQLQLLQGSAEILQSSLSNSPMLQYMYFLQKFCKNCIYCKIFARFLQNDFSCELGCLWTVQEGPKEWQFFHTPFPRIEWLFVSVWLLNCFPCIWRISISKTKTEVSHVKYWPLNAGSENMSELSGRFWSTVNSYFLGGTKCLKPQTISLKSFWFGSHVNKNEATLAQLWNATLPIIEVWDICTPDDAGGETSMILIVSILNFSTLFMIQAKTYMLAFCLTQAIFMNLSSNMENFHEVCLKLIKIDFSGCNLI